jgi:uncharacterized RDD family membrane protein YckC
MMIPGEGSAAGPSESQPEKESFAEKEKETREHARAREKLLEEDVRNWKSKIASKVKDYQKKKKVLLAEDLKQEAEGEAGEIAAAAQPPETAGDVGAPAPMEKETRGPVLRLAVPEHNSMERHGLQFSLFPDICQADIDRANEHHAEAGAESVVKEEAGDPFGKKEEPVPEGTGRDAFLDSIGEESENPAGDVVIYPRRQAVDAPAGDVEYEPLPDSDLPDTDAAGEAKPEPGKLPSGKHFLRRRSLAFVVDLMILSTVFLIHTFLTSRIADIPSGSMLSSSYIQFLLFHLFIFFVYFILFQVLVNQTIGMMFTNLQLVSFRNKALTPMVVFIRTLVFLLILLPAGAGLLFMRFNEDGFGLHDRVSGTGIIPTDDL